MSTPSVINNDLAINGLLTCTNFRAPPLSIGDPAVVGSPGAYVGAQKLGQQFQKEYAQPSAQAAAVETKVIHVTRGATGVIMDISFGAVVAAIGAATAVFDLLKNGVSILSAQITLDSSTAAYVLKAGTLSSTTTVVGDVFELKVVSATAGGGTLAKGLFARLCVREDPV
jgi:hypothetical protein